MATLTQRLTSPYVAIALEFRVWAHAGALNCLTKQIRQTEGETGEGKMRPKLAANDCGTMNIIDIWTNRETGLWAAYKTK